MHKSLTKKAKMKTKWLNRSISVPGPYLCLCLNETEFKKAFKDLGVNDNTAWISPHANATTHILGGKNGPSCVVCLEKPEMATGIEIAGLLVHEAVHVFQEWCNHYGEKPPAAEQEAYGIQAIAQELLQEYARRTVTLKNSSP